MRQILRIDPSSTAKIASLLGILWAILGWFLSGIVLSIISYGGGNSGELGNIPQSFSIGGLLSGIIGGFIGGGISGYLGALVYNWLVKKIGGIKVTLQEHTM